ncbi:hypothetical protein FF1_014299 [Malus domestica]
MRVKKPVQTINLMLLRMLIKIMIKLMERGSKIKKLLRIQQKRINLDQEATGHETKETENSKPKQIENTKTEQIDGHVKPLFEIPGPIPLLRDLVEVQRVKKSDGNVILGSEKEVISAPESESGSNLYTKEGKGCEVSVDESRRVKKRYQNVIPGSDKEVISAPESESRSDFYTKEEKGCEVSVEEAQRVKRGDETVIPASDEEVVSTPKESLSTGSQQTKNPWKISWEISDPFSDVDPRLYQRYFEEIPDDSSCFRW